MNRIVHYYELGKFYQMWAVKYQKIKEHNDLIIFLLIKNNLKIIAMNFINVKYRLI